MRCMPGVSVNLQSSIDFPDPLGAYPEGLVAVGGQLDVGTLYHAYRVGIFPWPQEGLPLLWFCPAQRGVLFFNEMHVPRRARALLKPDERFIFTRNRAFSDVIHACRNQIRPGQDGTWILPELIPAYERFHEAGFAQSFEVWRDGILVGGLYGVLVDGVFSGESMFHREDDASKRALLYAVECLKNEGLTWMDTQMVTPIVKSFGGRLIAKRDFLRLMREGRIDGDI